MLSMDHMYDATRPLCPWFGSPAGLAASSMLVMHAHLLRRVSRRFDEAAAFNQDIGRWNTARVLSMDNM